MVTIFWLYNIEITPSVLFSGYISLVILGLPSLKSVLQINKYINVSWTNMGEHIAVAMPLQVVDSVALEVFPVISAISSPLILRSTLFLNALFPIYVCKYSAYLQFRVVECRSICVI